MIKKLILSILVVSTFAHAGGHFEIDMSCGEVESARSGKLHKRLIPNLFNTIPKFTLRTKFVNQISYEVNAYSKRQFNKEVTDSIDDVIYTNFSMKSKFRAIKRKLRAKIRKSRRNDKPLYACVGHISVHPFKYFGSHVYTSSESVEAAMKKMRTRANKFL